MKKNYFLTSLILFFIGFNANSQITAPFTEEFNSGFPVATWNQSATTGGPWITGGTMGYNASTIADHSGTAGSSFTWLDYSGTDAGVIMMSDTIDVSSVPKPELSFWFNNNLGTNPCDPFNPLFIEGYDGTSWVVIDLLQQDNLGVWSEHYYDLCSFVLPGNKVLVRFRAEPGATISGSRFYHDLAIDDISVDTLRVNCFQPQALTADSITDFSATLRWGAGCSDTAWSVKLGLQGFDPLTAGTYTHTNVDTLSVITLNDFVDYDFYVRSYCNLGDTSAWAGPFSFKTLPTCVPPINQTVSNVTEYTATLKWDSGAGPNPDTAWSIKYDTLGFDPLVSGTYAHVNVDTANVSSLSPNTRYDFYVRGYCNSGDTSAWIGPLTFKTLCITDTIPYLQDFTYWTPDCWDMSGGVNNWNSYTPFGAPQPGIAEADFWGISSGDFRMTTQPIHLTAFARLSFDWSHLYNSTYPLDAMEVQVKVDTSSTWTQIWASTGAAFNSNDGAQSTAPGSFKNEVINLDSSYIGQNVLVRFIATSGYGPDCFVDNVILEEVPSCPRPTLLSHHALFSDSVALNWLNGAADSIWQIQYGLPSFPLGTGTTVADNNDSIAFGGLTPSTTYWAYVRSICTVGDTSIWEGPYAFTTPCSFYTPPYLEDFSTYSFSVNPTCWEEATGILTVNSTVTVGTSLWTNRASFANNGLGNNAAVMNIYFTGRNEWLLSPSIDLGSGAIPYQVEFDVAITDYFNSSAPSAGGLMGPDDKLVLVISTDNGVTWSDTNILAQWDTANMPSNTGDYFYYDLTAAGYTGQVRFGLYAESSVSNEDNDAFIDNFAVVQVPTCPRPLGLTFDSATQTTANISWTNGSADSSWIMEYGTPGFTQGSGTMVNSGTNPGVITGLTASTCYDVYLRSVCTAGDSSLWIGPMRFCTDCAPVVDLCEDYEGYGASTLPICWEKFIISTGSSTVGINTFGGSAAPNAVQMNASNDAGATMFLITPEMTALSAGTHRISFWADGSFTTDTVLIIGTMSDPANPATFTAVDTIKTISNAYQQFRIPIPATTDTRVAFQYVATATYRSITIDDFCFEVIPSCEKAPFPTILNDGVDSNVLNLGWNVDTSQTSFIINYGPAGYDPVTNTAGEV
ncbi:fibronectin type III domain-containing protein, partial [bacterium]|nr:fibronectin type III domain-containing protein [bacterium]